MQGTRLSVLSLTLLCGLAPVTWAGPAGPEGPAGAAPIRDLDDAGARVEKGDIGRRRPNWDITHFSERACQASLDRSVDANRIKAIVNRDGEKFFTAPSERRSQRPGKGGERGSEGPCGLQSPGGDSSAHGCCLQQCTMQELSSARNLMGTTISLYRGGRQPQLFHTCTCQTRHCAHECECQQGQRAVLAMTSRSKFDYIWVNSCCRSVFKNSS